MIVDIRQTGGLAGLTRRGTLDTATLDPGVAADVEGALRSLLASPAVGSAPQPDRLVYELAINDGAAPQTVKVNERDIPAPLLPLLGEAIAQGTIA